MSRLISALVAALSSAFRTRAALELEILALRHQMGVLQRSSLKRPRLTPADRLLWAWLSRLWSEWRTSLVIVKPQTVVAWHRKGLRLFWTWKGRHGQAGRATVSAESQWVARQRHLKQQGLLSNDRWRSLKALGLDWKTGDSIAPRWERCFLRLLEFRRGFGHCHVPAEWAENINLGRWVVKTRRLKNAGRLSVDMVLRLNDVGFVWDAIGKRQGEHDAVWSEWLAKLNTYHQKYGHWRVPTEQRRFHRLRRARRAGNDA